MLEFIQEIKQKQYRQYLISLALIISIASICYFTVEFIGYKVVALILLLVVSVLGMIFDIVPVLIAAIFSAVIWNVFFIPPVFNYSIGTPEDILLFLMYFVIALMNAILTSKIRKAENKNREKEGREKTIKLYNTLLNSLSHELRTPISAIIGAVDSLNDNKYKLSEIQKQDLLSEIDTAAIRLNQQVENLLNMSRIESGFIKPKLDWCDLNELVHKVIQNNFNEITHTIEIEIDENIPLFKLDGGLIEQALYNIIQNAIQYTSQNTLISINIGYCKGLCTIIIIDDGPGFPETKIDLVFDKFYRLSGNVTGGIGLGLSIVKGFIEAHNGKIMLENSEKRGAKFTIQIPSETSYPNDIKNE